MLISLIGLSTKLEAEQSTLSVIAKINKIPLVLVVRDKGSKALADIVILKSLPISIVTSGNGSRVKFLVSSLWVTKGSETLVPSYLYVTITF